MRILYISTSFPREEESSTIYTDLAEELVRKDHEVCVVVAEEKKKNSGTQLFHERGMDVLRVRTGNLYDVGMMEKGITVLLLELQLKKAINKYLQQEQFDLILFESPPITTASVVEWAMEKFDCPSYLMLKDIFPQNAVDIGIMTAGNPVYRYFSKKERHLYHTATIIGTMSEANRQYVLAHQPDIAATKVKIFPNTKKVREWSPQSSHYSFREKFEIPKESVLAVYGGNMGKPQGLDFLLDVMDSNKGNEHIFFLLVGRGTERLKIQEFIEEMGIRNARLLESLPRDEYEEMLREADIGLVFLDRRFTIPNFPSRVLSYFEMKLPVLAGIDRSTDFGKMLLESKGGDYVISGDVEGFNEKLNDLIKHPEVRAAMGEEGYRYLNTHYRVEKSVEWIEEHISALSEGSEGNPICSKIKHY